MTYFSIYDPEEPIQIQDAKGSFCNFCVGANLDEDSHINQDQSVLTEQPNKISKPKKVFTKPGPFKTALFWVCGIESSLKEVQQDVHQEPELIDTSISENKFWSNVCDANAVFAIALSGFCIAFLNKFD